MYAFITTLARLTDCFSRSAGGLARLGVLGPVDWSPLILLFLLYLGRDLFCITVRL